MLQLYSRHASSSLTGRKKSYRRSIWRPVKQKSTCEILTGLLIMWKFKMAIMQPVQYAAAQENIDDETFFTLNIHTHLRLIPHCGWGDA